MRPRTWIWAGASSLLFAAGLAKAETPAPRPPASAPPRGVVPSEPVVPMAGEEEERVEDTTTTAHSSRRVMRVMSWAAIGLGAASIGVGTYFGVRTFEKRDDADALCRGRLCSQEGLDLQSDARTAATISTITISAGAVLVTAGVVYLLLSGRQRESVVLAGAPGGGVVGIRW